LVYIPSGIYQATGLFSVGFDMRNEIHSERHVRLRTLMKRERKSAGLKQTDIAKKTSRSQAYISKFENGDLRLDVIDFMLFCEVIGCDPHAILKEIYSEK